MKKLIVALFFVATPLMAQVPPTEALLEWDYATNDVTFILERKDAACSASGSWTEVATIAGTARSHRETGLLPGASYCWRLYAENAVGRSAPSNEVGKSVMALPVAPTLRVQ